MPRSYQRAEKALKRAQEFIDVGKQNKALDVLYEVIKKSKMRAIYSEKVLQPIMQKFFELCVNQKKSYYAKEGLYQFRNLFQNVNVMALENAVRLLLRLADERTETARLESHLAVVDVEDLDCPRTSEEIILSAVSYEGATERSDRTILTPWVKFLWEIYRHCLDLLRINSKVERLYHDIAKHAFKFCEKYERKTEFRKLCENLRNHLLNIQKQQGSSTTAVNLNNPETQQLNLETRLEQLNYAIKMELWQEAYKAIEDTSDLMMKSKKMPKPHVMASYYQKLALVFWKAKNYLFHAAALFKLFQLLRDQKKNITVEELSKRASTVLVATLAIPLPSAHPEFDRFIETEKSALEKIDKLAFLLNIPKPPTRASLIKDLSRLNIVTHVHPELHNMYMLMEVEFDPLNLCTKMQGYIDWITERPESGLPQYIPPLQDMTICRLIKQVAQIYQTIKFDRLHELAVFVSPFYLERILVDLVRHNDIQIRIDHRSRCINFGMDLSESQREDLPEGPSLQTLPSETIRCQLVQMSSTAKKCIDLIVPDIKKKEMEPIRAQTILLYQQTRRNDHLRLLQRQHTIEERKELLETQNLEREEFLRRQTEEQQRRQKEEEQERLRREANKREKERHEEQIKQIQTKQIKEKLLQISKTTYGAKMIEKIDKEELLSLGPEEILQRQVEELEKERKEQQKKLKAQEKLIDHYERAKRLIQIPKLKTQIEKQKEEDKEFWQVQETDRIKKLVEEHELAYKTSVRLAKMMTEKHDFVEKLKSQRRSELEKKLEEFNEKLKLEREKRLLLRKELRKKERRDAYYNDKAEKEQQRKEEELKKQREDEERMEQERMQMEEEERANRTTELENRRNVLPARTDDDKSRPWRPNRVAASHIKEQEKINAWRVNQDEPDRGTAWSRNKEPDERNEGSKFMSRDIRRDEPQEDTRRENKRDDPREQNRDKFRRRDDNSRDDFRRRDDNSRDDFRRRDDNSRDDFRRRDDNSRDDFRRRDDNSRDDFRRRDEPSRNEFRRRDEPSRNEMRREPAREEFRRRDEPRDNFKRDEKRAWDRFKDREDTSTNDCWRRGGKDVDREPRREDDRGIRRDFRRDDRRDRRDGGGDRRDDGGKAPWRPTKDEDNEPRNNNGTIDDWRDRRRDDRREEKRDDNRRDVKRDEMREKREAPKNPLRGGKEEFKKEPKKVQPTDADGWTTVQK